MIAPTWFARLSRGKRVLISVAIVIVLVAAGTLVYLIGPDPMDFASGKRVAIANYKDGDPTGVPASRPGNPGQKR